MSLFLLQIYNPIPLKSLSIFFLFFMNKIFSKNTVRLSDNKQYCMYNVYVNGNDIPFKICSRTIKTKHIITLYGIKNNTETPIMVLPHYLNYCFGLDICPMKMDYDKFKLCIGNDNPRVAYINSTTTIYDFLLYNPSLIDSSNMTFNHKPIQHNRDTFVSIDETSFEQE